jgi:decaprenyl-phosphate phosphoribosyltransferase
MKEKSFWLNKIEPYLEIARPGHWAKNIFIFPGIVLALFFNPYLLTPFTYIRIFLALVCSCLLASSNYVLNEIVDAKFDKFHPEKAKRAIPSGKVNIKIAYLFWLFLAVIGLLTAFSLGLYFGLSSLSLWIMGICYNVRPLRFKDVPYIDVLSEAINNPIRLVIGWYAVGISALPPLSIVLAYWMFGAFLMGIKRFAEYRHIADPERAGRYRKPFSYYTEEKLLLSILYYAAFFGMMSGVFIARYRLELVLASPLIAYTMAYYLHVGFKPNSPAQHPELLFTQKKLILLVFLAFGACILFLFWDVPLFKEALMPRVLPK